MDCRRYLDLILGIFFKEAVSDKAMDNGNGGP